MPDPQDFCQWCALPFDWETCSATNYTSFCSAHCERLAAEQAAQAAPPASPHPRAVFAHRDRPGRHMAFEATQAARLRRAVRRFERKEGHGAC